MTLESLEALRRLRRAADKAVRRAVVWAPLLAAFLGGALPARAAPSAQLNINIHFDGITSVSDLAASPGTSTGTIALSWTEPYHPGGSAPYSYDIRVSSQAQISNEAAFNVALPLSAFSSSAIPSPGAGGGAAGFIVDGLTPDVTYYFALREKDSTSFRGAWVRTAVPSRNQNNFAIATSTRPAPPAGGGAIAVFASSLTATWGVSAGATDYVLLASTSSANPPVLIAASSTTASSTATLSGLGPDATYFLFVSACNGGCSAFAALGSTITLAAPDVSLSTTALSSSTVSLAWDGNGNPSTTVQRVQVSTDNASFATVATVTGLGASYAGLTGGTTYYFRVVAVNGAGVAASPSPVLTVVTPTGPTPSSPSGLAATAGLLRAALSWNPLPPAQQGIGLLYYELYRSLNSGFGFVRIATTTATSYTDLPLAAGTTYFYKVGARDRAQTLSAQSAAVSAVPYAIGPMEPLGLKVVPSSSSVTFTWSPTTRFNDGSAFLSTGTPTADELKGYVISRSTDICNINYVQLSTLPVTATSLTDATGGLNYYYHLNSYNSVGVSVNSYTISSLGERDYFVDDCASAIVLDDATAQTLNAASNGLGDIRLKPARRPQDVGDGVFQSVEFRAYLNGATELKNFTLPKAVRVQLHFDLNNGVPAPSTSPVTGQSVRSAPAGSAGAAAVSVNDLGMYWNNGVEFKKMYGRVDPVSQVVTVQSPNLGVYQVRALARSAGVVFDLSNLASRVITPNGDGLNDVMILTYDPGPAAVVPEGKIYDMRGAFVADMAAGLVPNTLTWNGMMNGVPAASGVYMYRVTGGGKTFTGTIVVAK
jgi:fibronectin type 3 domain-containing protein